MGNFFGSKILNAGNTSFEEDLNRLSMLSLKLTISATVFFPVEMMLFAEGSIASSSELRVASSLLEIRVLVCRAWLLPLEEECSQVGTLLLLWSD